VMIPGVFELDVNGDRSGAHHRPVNSNVANQRKVA
jgi:hypothetical protein